VPIILPTSVYAPFRAGPRNVSLIPDGPLCSRRNQINNGKPGDRLCYPLQQREKIPLLPEDSYITTNDPEDPAFYSTCFFRIKPTSLPPAPVPIREPDWQFHHKCVDCGEAIKTTYEHYIPMWNISNTCRNCDIDGPAKASIPVPKNWTAPLPWTKMPNGVCVNKDDPKTQYTCVNTTACTIGLGLYGMRGDMSFRDCYELARNRKECGRVVYMTTPYQNDPAQCTCWTNHTATNACCGACVVQPQGNNYYNMYYLEDQPPFK